MIEELRKVIVLLGPSNALTIIVFVIGVFVAFYFYFRTFFRLVYSTGRICRNGRDIKDWRNKNTEFITRVLIYNNGRKTLSCAEIKQLEIYSSGEVIKNVRILKGKENLKIAIIDNKINLDIDYIDSKNYFVFEVEHKGLLVVNGRVSESGKILETEPKFWLWFNIVAISLVTILLFYSMDTFFKSEHPQYLSAIINVLFLLGISWTIRFIHALLFIPDKLSSKYLGAKDKWSNAFRNDY